MSELLHAVEIRHRALLLRTANRRAVEIFCNQRTQVSWTLKAFRIHLLVAGNIVK